MFGGERLVDRKKRARVLFLATVRSLAVFAARDDARERMRVSYIRPRRL
jgi:hypothetical protein